ncbi:MAG: hypothetical protein FWE07_02185 [Turicibacter sp.]|nr:hypothetical protein [Turicibacter sp.]
MKNFIYQLVDVVNQLELDVPVKIGIFDETESLMVKPASGSQIIHEYMDGSVDIRLPFEISIKKANQEEAFTVLQDVLNHIKNSGEYLSHTNNEEKEAHLLLHLTMDQIPVFQAHTDGYFIYTSYLTVDLTVA